MKPTCFRELLLLALPFRNGHVVDGDVALKPIATDSLEHYLKIQEKYGFKIQRLIPTGLSKYEVKTLIFFK